MEALSVELENLLVQVLYLTEAVPSNYLQVGVE